MSGAGAGTTVRGRVAAVLPRGLFAVRTAEGELVAGLGREAAHVVRVKPGDVVDVRLSPRDPTRGRIVALAKDAPAGSGSGARAGERGRGKAR